MPVPAAKEEPKDEDPAESMSLKGHLTELRSRLIKSALSILVVFIGLFSFAPYIRGMLGKVLKAVLPPGGAITFVDINRGLHCGHASGLCPELLCGQPVHLLPDLGVYRPCGLYDSERKCVVPLALCSALLFIAGGAFCYGVVIPFTYGFFINYGGGSATPLITLANMYRFSLKLMLAFGVMFEMPLFSFFLTKLRAGAGWPGG